MWRQFRNSPSFQSQWSSRGDGCDVILNFKIILISRWRRFDFNCSKEISFRNSGDHNEGLWDVSCCEAVCICTSWRFICTTLHSDSETTTSSSSLLFQSHVPYPLPSFNFLLRTAPHSHQMLGVTRWAGMWSFYMYDTLQFSVTVVGSAIFSYDSYPIAAPFHKIPFLVCCFKFALNSFKNMPPPSMHLVLSKLFHGNYKWNKRVRCKNGDDNYTIRMQLHGTNVYIRWNRTIWKGKPIAQ